MQECRSSNPVWLHMHVGEATSFEGKREKVHKATISEHEGKTWCYGSSLLYLQQGTVLYSLRPFKRNPLSCSSSTHFQAPGGDTVSTFSVTTCYSRVEISTGLEMKARAGVSVGKAGERHNQKLNICSCKARGRQTLALTRPV